PGRARRRDRLDHRTERRRQVHPPEGHRRAPGPAPGKRPAQGYPDPRTPAPRDQRARRRLRAAGAERLPDDDRAREPRDGRLRRAAPEPRPDRRDLQPLFAARRQAAARGGAPAPRRPAARTTRRTLLTGAAALAVSGFPVARGLAQGDAIRLGTLTPLTGAGGNYGPSMRRAMEWVVEQVNGAGGVLGRRIQLFNEDDQTNPDAAVRAARKLIDVDRVAAIMGTWASAVTTAVAPLCWESKTFLTTVSGADSITLLPHQGY